MKVNEVISVDPEQNAVNSLKQNAARAKQQASAAAARLKVQRGQQQLAKAVQPIKPMKMG